MLLYETLLGSGLVDVEWYQVVLLFFFPSFLGSVCLVLRKDGPKREDLKLIIIIFLKKLLAKRKIAQLSF